MKYESFEVSEARIKYGDSSWEGLKTAGETMGEFGGNPDYLSKQAAIGQGSLNPPTVAKESNILERIERLEKQMEMRTQESLQFYEQTKNIIRRICQVIGIDG